MTTGVLCHHFALTALKKCFAIFSLSLLIFCFVRRDPPSSLCSSRLFIHLFFLFNFTLSFTRYLDVDGTRVNHRIITFLLLVLFPNFNIIYIHVFHFSFLLNYFTAVFVSSSSSSSLIIVMRWWCVNRCLFFFFFDIELSLLRLDLFFVILTSLFHLFVG